MKKVLISSLVSVILTLLAGSPSLGQVINVGDATNFSKSLTVSPGSTLTMKVDRGDIQITGADQNTIDVEVQRRVTRASDSDAPKILREEEVTIEQTGNSISITSKVPPSLRQASSWWSGERPNLDVHYEITVPRKFEAQVETGGGNVKIASLDGGVNIQTAGGNLDCKNITGNVEGRTSGGNITATSVRGGVNVQTSGGNLDCEYITGDLDGGTSGGNVKVANVRGKANAQTSGGNLDCEDITGDVDCRTSGGRVHAHGCHSRLQLQTSGGDITIEGFTGSDLHASSGGGSVSADFVAAPKADSGLDTSGGNVTVRLPDNAAFDLDAHTDGGLVKTDLPVTVEGKLSADKLKGTVNGGGPLLKLQTSGGDIKILKL